MSFCRKPRRNLWQLREALAAEGPRRAPLEVSWQDIAVTCVWWCPGRQSVAHAFKWLRVVIWKCSGTRNATGWHQWKGFLLSLGMVCGGWALWRPVVQDLRGVKPWRQRLEEMPRSSVAMRKSLGEAVVFRIQVRTRSVPLRLL